MILIHSLGQFIIFFMFHSRDYIVKTLRPNNQLINKMHAKDLMLLSFSPIEIHSSLEET
jgi:hypothetical protein